MKYPVINTKATGEHIRQLRKEKHIKVEELAEYMGFESPQAIYKWQRGDSLPTLDNLFALARIFEVSMDEVIIGDDEEEVSRDISSFLCA